MKTKEYKNAAMKVVEIRQHDVIATSGEAQAAGLRDYTVQDSQDW